MEFSKYSSYDSITPGIVLVFTQINIIQAGCHQHQQSYDPEPYQADFIVIIAILSLSCSVRVYQSVNNEEAHP